MHVAQPQQSVSAHPSRGWNTPHTILGKKTLLRSKLNYKSITMKYLVFDTPECEEHLWFIIWFISIQHTEKGQANSSLLEMNLERLWSLRPNTVPGWSSLQSAKIKCKGKWSTQWEGVKSYIAMELRSISMKWRVSHGTRNCTRT